MARKAQTAPPRRKAEPNVTTVPESRRDKFERLMTARMNRALNAIRLIGNLSTANYEWHENDLQVVRTAIADVTNSSLARFEKRPRGQPIEFTLPAGQREPAE